MDWQCLGLIRFGPPRPVEDVADAVRLSPNRVRGLVASSQGDGGFFGVCATTCSPTHD